MKPKRDFKEVVLIVLMVLATVGQVGLIV